MEKIENCPGFNEMLDTKLIKCIEDQTKTYGAEIKTGEEVFAIEKIDQFINLNSSVTFITLIHPPLEMEIKLTRNKHKKVA